MQPADILVVAAKYRIAAFRKADGESLWETALITGFFNVGEPFVTLTLDEKAIYAHTKNQLFCLELMTGKILWQKEVPNLGRDVASIAMLNGTSPQTAAAMKDISFRRQSSGD